MTLPPILLGGVKFTVTEPFPGVAVPIWGAAGTPSGVTVFESTEVAPSPMAFCATTAQLIGTPLLKPFTVMGEPRPVALWPPQLAR